MSDHPATPIALPEAGTGTANYFEHTWVHGTQNVRAALRLDKVPRVVLLKSLFGSIVVTKIEVEVVQVCEVDNGNSEAIAPGGIFFVGLIPSGKDTEALSGSNSSVVYKVPRTAACPLSQQSQQVFKFTLPHQDYETDLALDPRKQQAIVLWSGNAGYRGVDPKKDVALALVRWKVWVDCSGSTTIW